MSDEPEILDWEDVPKIRRQPPTRTPKWLPVLQKVATDAKVDGPAAKIAEREESGAANGLASNLRQTIKRYDDLAGLKVSTRALTEDGPYAVYVERVSSNSEPATKSSPKKKAATKAKSGGGKQAAAKSTSSRRRRSRS